MDTEILENQGTETPVETPSTDASVDYGYDDAILPDDYVAGQDYSLDNEQEDPTAPDAEDSALEEDPTAPETSAADDQAQTQPAAPAEESPAADQPDTSEKQAADTEQQDTPAPSTYKFTDTFQGMSREVEVNMQDIPAMYRKAQTADYVVRKISVNEKNARSLGYESVEDMIAKVRTSLIDTETNKLVDENVHEAVARDIASRRYAPLETMAPPRQAPAFSQHPQQPARNIVGEINELYAAHPGMRGQELPQSVAQAALGGKNLLSAYNEFLQQNNAAEMQRLSKENAILRQNAAAAAKAPVRGVTSGGATETKPTDDWEVGFNSDNYY